MHESLSSDNLCLGSIKFVLWNCVDKLMIYKDMKVSETHRQTEFDKKIVFKTFCKSVKNKNQRHSWIQYAFPKKI